MTNAHATLAAQAAVAASHPATPARYDIYVNIHKALRLFMSDTLARVGRLDVDDPIDLGAVLGQVQSLLEICRGHLNHENRFVHPAIEARQPGASGRIAGEHVEHVEAIAALDFETVALRALPTAAAALRLYRHLARFVAENFEHMHVEETQHNAVLWATCSDAEIADIEHRLVASIAPAEMAVMARWMVPALNPAERAVLLQGMQAQLPPQAMQGLLDIVRPHLDERGWAKLSRALAMAAAPALVTA